MELYETDSQQNIDGSYYQMITEDRAEGGTLRFLAAVLASFFSLFYVGNLEVIGVEP